MTLDEFMRRALRLLGHLAACAFIVACAAFMGWAVGGAPL